MSATTEQWLYMLYCKFEQRDTEAVERLEGWQSLQCSDTVPKWRCWAPCVRRTGLDWKLKKGRSAKQRWRGQATSSLCYAQVLPRWVNSRYKWHVLEIEVIGKATSNWKVSVSSNPTFRSESGWKSLQAQWASPLLLLYLYSDQRATDTGD